MGSYIENMRKHQGIGKHNLTHVGGSRQLRTEHFLCLFHCLGVVVLLLPRKLKNLGVIFYY